MKSLGILKFEDMVRINILKWYYKYRKGKLPSYFLSYNIRQHSELHTYNTRNSFIIPRNTTRLHGSRYCLRNHASVVLNSFSQNVLDKIYTHSYAGFSRYAKHTIIASYSVDCDIHNCYVCGT